GLALDWYPSSQQTPKSSPETTPTSRGFENSQTRDASYVPIHAIGRQAEVSEKELQHAEDLADEGRPSELQAAATSLDERLRAERDDALRDIETQRCETSRQRLEAVRDVLDQGEVEAKMHLVADFARHLKRINEQRAQLLARAKEPVAVEHILVDRNHHRYLVDSTSWMSRLIRTLPELAEMLRFLLSFDLRNLAGTQQGEGEADQSSGVEGMVARLEQFVYEVEQAQSWAESEKPSAHTSGGKLPRFIMAKPKKQ
ncbi:hypothetical protein EV182_002845, partial [Spiromyces aspiralis]